MKYTHVIALAGASAAIVSAAPTPNAVSYDALVPRFGDSSASSGAGSSTGASTAGSAKTDLKEETPSTTQSHVHHHSNTHHSSLSKGTGKKAHPHKKATGDKDRLEDTHEHVRHHKQTTGGTEDLASKKPTHPHKSDAASTATGQSLQRRSFDQYLYPRFGRGLVGLFRHHGKGVAEGAGMAVDNLNSRRDLEYMESIEARDTSSASGSGSSVGSSTAGSAKTDLKEETPSTTQSHVHHHSNTHQSSFGKGTGKKVHQHKKAAGDKDRLEDAHEHGHRKQTGTGSSQDLAGKRPKDSSHGVAAGQSPQRRSFDEDLYDFEARDIPSASGSGSSAGSSTAGSAKTDIKEETPSTTQSHVHHHSNIHQSSFGKGTGKKVHQHKKAAGDKDRLEDAHEHGSRKHTGTGSSQDLTGKHPKDSSHGVAAGQSLQRRSFDEDLYDFEARDIPSASGSGSSAGSSTAGSAKTDLKEETPSTTQSHVHHHSNTHQSSFGKGTGKKVHQHKKAAGDKDQLEDAREPHHHKTGVKKGVEMASQHHQGSSNDDSNQPRDLEDMEIASRDVGFDDGELSARDVELIKLAVRSFVDDFELNELD